MRIKSKVYKLVGMYIN